MPRSSVVERLHPRDIEILHTLYRVRAMSAKHIADLFYSHIVNARRRIRQYREMGWIDKYPYRRLMYHITDRGLGVLGDHVFIPFNEKAHNLMIGRARIRAYEHFVDLIVATRRHGWDFVESRAAKAELSLPDASYLQGMLIAPGGEKYPVFVLSARSTRRTLFGVLRDTRAIIAAEHPRIPGIIVTVAGEETYRELFSIPALGDFFLPVHLLPSAYARRAVPCLLPFSEHSHKYGLVPAGEEGCPYRAGGRCVTELLTLTHTNLIRLRYGTPAGEVWAAEETAPLIRAVTGKSPDRVVKIPCASSP
ncbi:MAG: hypothetical protein HSCHL_2032 [Hydrogenibacillus schlegelii]|uniref:Protein involved in plasmid replication-relaxation n=1 Tax=Hydrogenibacillus schlegelii TaxID=1484 RepID=A0A2T5G430_HYDSH|nr:MAG: hypothetical protein HSCHL_2032 [Hydrogenibacillus schlegelii]